MKDIKIGEEYLLQAQKLHREHPVVDAHLDLAGEILLRHKAGERDVIRRHYLSHFQKAGITLVVSSVYVENGAIAKGWENALAQIKALKEELAGLEEAALVEKGSDITLLAEEGKIGVLLYMEGLDCIGKDTHRLEELYRLGVRGASLTWSRPNELATGCCKALEHRQVPGKLSEAGVRAVKKLEELSMFLDVSHLNDEGFWQVCRIAQRPFIATHSGQLPEPHRRAALCPGEAGGDHGSERL